MKKHHQLMVEDGCPEFLLRDPEMKRVRLRRKVEAPAPVDPVQAEQDKRRAVIMEHVKRKRKRALRKHLMRLETKATFATEKPLIWNATRCRWEEA